MKTIVFRGMKIRIENEAGTVRSGIDRLTGKPWATKMTHDYGEIVGTVGVDGDPVDCFIGPDTSAPFVYVVHQLQKQTGEWDEDKCFLGFDSTMDAKQAYYKNFDNGDMFYGSIEAIPLAVFKKQILSNRGETMIHAKMDVTVGDPVTCDGCRGRGVVVADDGSDVVIRFRNGEYFKRKKYNVTHLGDNMYKSRYATSTVRAARLEPVEMEGNPIRVPHGMNKRIEKVGTLFCVKSDGVDKDFGCYASREQAEAVLQGKSFIEPALPANMYAVSINDSGWQAHPTTAPHITKPHSTIAKPKPMTHLPGPKTLPKPGPIVKSKPFHPPSGSGTHLPNQSMKNRHTGSGHKFTLESFGDMGEPMAGALGHAHIEPESWFHPPSLTKRKKADYVPTDNPGEKDDRFLDVTKRKQAHTDRMKRLKRSAPGGLPPYIPAVTTGLAPHQSSFAPTIAGAQLKVKKRKPADGGLLDVIVPRNATLRVPHAVAYTPGKQVRARSDDRGIFVKFNHQGCL